MAWMKCVSEQSVFDKEEFESLAESIKTIYNILHIK
jgi:hypothetical protein